MRLSENAVNIQYVTVSMKEAVAVRSWLLFLTEGNVWLFVRGCIVNLTLIPLAALTGSMSAGCGDSCKLSGDSGADSGSREPGVGMRGGFAENMGDFMNRKNKL